jgi:hypothetical protein
MSGTSTGGDRFAAVKLTSGYVPESAICGGIGRMPAPSARIARGALD